jgi:hypothetical protein
MKPKQNVKIYIICVIIYALTGLTSCEKHEYCAECWEDRPLFLIGSGDVSFCSDDAGMVGDFMDDYENGGWTCKFKD